MQGVEPCTLSVLSSPKGSSTAPKGTEEGRSLGRSAYRCRTVHRSTQQAGRSKRRQSLQSRSEQGHQRQPPQRGGPEKSRNVKVLAARSARALHCRRATSPLGHNQYSTPRHATTCDGRRNDATPHHPNNTAMGPNMGKPLFNRTRFSKPVVLHLCTCYTQCWRPPCESVCP